MAKYQDISTLEDVQRHMEDLDDRLVVVEVFQTEHEKAAEVRLQRVVDIEQKLSNHVDDVLTGVSAQEQKRNEFEVKVMSYLGTISSVVLKNNKDTKMTTYIVASIFMMVMVLTGVVIAVGAKIL